MTAPRIRIADPYRAYHAQIGELPRRMVDEGATLHAGRNRIRTLTLSSPGRDTIDVAVKAFAVPALPRGLVYAHLRQSKAVRSMVNALRLMEIGIGTPDPIACIEYRDFGCLRRSYYVCRFLPHDYDLTALLYRGIPQGTNTEALLDQLARFTFQQHDRGVLHCDYNPGNILVRSRSDTFDFSIVDLNRLCFRQLDINDRISGLVRLTTVVEYREIMGRRYAKLHGMNPEEFCRALERQQSRFALNRRRVKRLKSLVR